jgi:hypothetical protein
MPTTSRKLFADVVKDFLRSEKNGAGAFAQDKIAERKTSFAGRIATNKTPNAFGSKEGRREKSSIGFSVPNASVNAPRAELRVSPRPTTVALNA